jgi:hypothetical protein
MRVCDNNTKKCVDYKVTGKITSDGSTMTVPTDKGPFSFAFGTDKNTGAPTVNINGPDGFKEIAALLGMQGPGGIWVFDPLTGLSKFINGQPIPLNPNFGTGMNLVGTKDGPVGTYGPNPWDILSSINGQGASSSNPLALPSVPTDNLWVGVLMLLGIVGAVVVVRTRKAG